MQRMALGSSNHHCILVTLSQIKELSLHEVWHIILSPLFRQYSYLFFAITCLLEAPFCQLCP